MTEEPESLVLELLRQMRAELGDVRSDMATKADLASLRADVAADMHTLRAEILSTRKDLRDQINGLRQTVVDYQAMALRVCPSLRRVTAPAKTPSLGRTG